jgi:aldose 1-epimerase
VLLRDPTSPLNAEFVPETGMIGISLRDGDQELLGQRRGLQAYVENGKTFGLPLLYPWANRLSATQYTVAGQTVQLQEGARGLRFDAPGIPMHGVMAAAPEWTVQAGDASLRATFDFGAHPELLASFPFPHRIEYAVSLRNRRLTVDLTVTPTGDVAVPLAFGFHPYLTLPGVPRAQWQIEVPALRHLPVDDRGLPTGEAIPQPAEPFTLGDRHFDDGYDSVAPGSRFVVAGGGRRLTVVLEQGYPAAQLFAPLGQEFICFEPMAAPTNALVTGRGLRLVQPGSSETATFWIQAD